MAATAEDRLLTKILGVSLQYQGNADSGIVYLADLAQVSSLQLETRILCAPRVC